MLEDLILYRVLAEQSLAIPDVYFMVLDDLQTGLMSMRCRSGPKLTIDTVKLSDY